MCGVYPDADVMTAGQEISSTYEGRHITLYASELTHAGSVVTKGLPVVFGDAVGIAFSTEVAGTDLIAVDTEGIWVVDVVATNDAGNSAVVPGDRLFINTTTCVVSKITNVATQIPFGYALGSIDAGNTNTIAVKVHHDPNYENDLQIWKTILSANPGAFAAAFKLIVNNSLAQTGTRICAMSVNLEPGAGLQAQAIVGAEVCTYLAADIPVAGAMTGLFVETQGGLSYASDVHSLYVYLAINAAPTGSAFLARFEHNSGTYSFVDGFLSIVGDAPVVMDMGPLASNHAWDDTDPAAGAITGHIKINIGGVERYLAVYSAH